MPRYFFDFIDEWGRLNDQEGQELSDAGAAYEVAHVMVGHLVRTTPHGILQCTFEVRDSKGEVVFVLPFAEAVSSPDRLN